MVIILFCTTLASLIYLNVLQSQNTGEKLKAFYILQKNMRDAESKADFLDADLKEEGFLVRKTCKVYKNDKNLVEVKLSAENEAGREVARINRIIVQ